MSRLNRLTVRAALTLHALATSYPGSVAWTRTANYVRILDTLRKRWREKTLTLRHALRLERMNRADAHSRADRWASIAGDMSAELQSALADKVALANQRDYWREQCERVEFESANARENNQRLRDDLASMWADLTSVTQERDEAISSRDYARRMATQHRAERDHAETNLANAKASAAYHYNRAEHAEMLASGHQDALHYARIENDNLRTIIRGLERQISNAQDALAS